MAFDGIVTRSVVRELDQTVAGGRVAKIYQPQKTDLVLTVRANGKNHRLLISANAGYARLYLTTASFENPQEPPTFCMLLRKHLEGAVLESVRQVDYERIVHINFRAKNEIGDDIYKRLIIEIMGKHSNIILIETENGTILDAIKRLTPAVNRYRTVLPGQVYVAPPERHKLNPSVASETDLLRALDFNAGKLDRQLVDAIDGFSPLLAREILHRAGLATKAKIVSAFMSVQEEIVHEDFKPTIYRPSSGKDDFHVLAITNLEGETQNFNSASAMLEAYYNYKAESDAVHNRTSDLSRMMRSEIKKNERKLAKLRKTLKEAEEAGQYQLYGELVTANMHQIKKGDRTAKVVNYYDENGGWATIPLDPNKTPAENAQNYFRKYNKLKTAKVEVEKQITHAEAEIAYLESISQQIESASLKDIAEIREELEEGGYVRRKTKTNRKQKPQKPEPEHYTASDGTSILVGKNNRQNDYLTTRLARPGEVWLHTKDIPGSHVVIRSGSAEVSEATLVEAANLAAYFSRSKLSSRVPVDYAEIRHVRKPSGAKPGYVIYDHQKTLFVTPDEQLVKKLKADQ